MMLSALPSPGACDVADYRGCVAACADQILQMYLRYPRETAAAGISNPRNNGTTMGGTSQSARQKRTRVLLLDRRERFVTLSHR